MYKYKFTVFTPTYNRDYVLENLYKDLKCQTYKDFEWLIVDDGSTDNTRELVDRFISEEKINIRYIYKENGGKHTAINTGVNNANGELFFIVDSDDRLIEDSIETSYKQWNLFEDKRGLCGLVGLCANTDGTTLGTKIPEDKKICHFNDLYYKFNVKGDKTLIFLTDILKKYPFPNIKGVKFIPESIVWGEISKNYKVICINKHMIVREYLEDGLTNNILSESSLRGRAIEYLYLINQNTYPINKYPYMWIKNYINLTRYSLLSKGNYYREINRKFDKLMCYLLYPLGYLKYKNQKDLIRK